MRQTDTDRAWKYFGQHNPYWGVVTSDQYDNKVLTEDAKSAFFDSGHQHVDYLLQTIQRHLDPGFTMRNVLDFGCGVGRILIPMAKQCESAVGIDISEAMLAEARENSIKEGVKNILLLQGDAALPSISQKFDLVHSFIVLQHIPPRRGEVIIRQLLDLVAAGGVAALHVTYHDIAPTREQWLISLYKNIPLLFQVRNILKGRPAAEPLMQMNTYDLNQIFELLQSSGFGRCYCEFTNHQFLGILIFCQR